ncbi:MAG: cyclic nucleotide-binding domain-containing protein [Acidobacteria bacterium]|nr:cyclic nucleotide-binding domain-containing protein [Acidobacteriota bacterium]
MELFADVPEEELKRVLSFPEQEFEEGEILLHEGDIADRLLVVLTGKFRLFRSGNTTVGELTEFHAASPTVIGEVGLLTEFRTPFNVEVARRTRAIVVPKEDFWSLMANCPALRSTLLRSSMTRFQMRQGMNLREEKLASLGTLTAGLMHELNNPGAAAGRAAAQLRANINRMHELAQCLSKEEHTPEQGRCFWEMQERVLRRKKATYQSSLDQADAEERLAEWMESNGVREAWRLAPTFAASGITASELECLKAEFHGEGMSDPLAWMEAMVGSMQMVETIEESVRRVSDLVGAVKTYTHEGQGQKHTVDVNASIHATLVILKHKLMERGTFLSKIFASNLPEIPARKASLNQVWTNLLDNAIDAAGEGGKVQVKTWQQDGEVFVSFCDDGPGIPREKQERIFDPFFTTKPAGVGTGLGLGIAFQIVKEYGGELRFSSQPGQTEFVVHLPGKA